MGAQQSKDELLSQQVAYGNAEAIKALRREGAGLEWMDKDGRTPLIFACTRGDLLNVAETLIDLGANINAYRPGSHGGTPLHHAAKRGLHSIARLLLSRGANAIVMNDDCQSPLDIAREKGFFHVVRVIEAHICLFSGWLRELSGPGFLGALVPQWASKKVWAVVIPSDYRNPTRPRKFELRIYPGLQAFGPRTVISLWKAECEEPNFNLPDPMLVIFDRPTKSKYKFLSGNDGDKQQIKSFHEACLGVPQPTSIEPNLPPPSAPTSTGPEDLQIAMAINASIQSAMEERPPPLPNPHQPSDTSHGDWLNKPFSGSYGGWTGPEPGPSSAPIKCPPSPPPEPSGAPPIMANNSLIVGSSCLEPSVPSAPPILEENLEGPIHYPSIDSSPIEVDTAVTEIQSGVVKGDKNSEGEGSGSCVICWDAPIEGACIPCGHMAGCMDCLKEIKAKGWGCPVCRTKIEQVMKVYAV
ncbi:putative E3 ubiquitin-protein ligase XBAT34 [Amborella trichopoda]|uniref:RING-type domain-containing protein n=1 Tax=Amborella trichopoda TaxID=13333 RepID=U5DED1_AMBTC|nr:putative E3 ubiquitin-protein ligase XBAT34 [Amborella trichopoda]ERN18763.1 hypothetical protein AMTR_s00067p00047970 [Amborella trichopoda]|eukprot:XP_006857296.1 putative E3 ubiquitin-protein ligase XBAT34 [Amborella trichopoda]